MQLWDTIRPLVILPVVVIADLPVHCLRHQIVGDWEFTLSPSKSERSSCGHQKPDSQDKQPALSLLDSLGPTTKLRLSVEDPDTVSTSQGKGGSWTMIYDEGFEVVVDGQVFFAFSKFEMVPDGRGGQTNVSHCGETFLGWYRDSSRTRWGCYFGNKVGHGDAPPRQPAALRSARGVPAKAPQATALVSKATSTLDLGELIGDDDQQATDQGSHDQRAADQSSQDQRVTDQASQDERAVDQGSMDARAVDQAPQDLQAQKQDQQPTERGSRELVSDQALRGQGEDQAPQDQGSVIEAAFAAVDDEPHQSAPVSKAASVIDSEPLQVAFAQAKLEQEAEGSDEDDAGVQDGNEEQAEVEQSSTSAPTARNEQSFLADAYTMPSSYTPWVPKSAGYDKPMPHHFQQAVAEALNFMQLGWIAAPYRMFTGKTPRELNRFAGVRRSRIPPQRKGKTSTKLAHAVESPEPLSFLGLGSRRKKHRHRDQQSLDWRKVNGRNWLVPVVSQGDCGSCYAISTVHMLTARNRIKRGDPSEPAFSVTFPLRCSEYNQGCNGGYGFLESKWAEDVGLVPESCSPFSDDTDGVCQGLEDCDLGDKRYRAVNHRYVGGFYGGSDHEAIKRELVSNGPLVLSFEPKEDFMYYKTGLYKSGKNKIHQEWEQVDHAVLLVGLGLDAEQPYWVLQNSWGTEWGEQGFFRMARGIDESGCESIAVAADVMQDSSNDVLDNFLASL